MVRWIDLTKEVMKGLLVEVIPGVNQEWVLTHLEGVEKPSQEESMS